jgi:membrane protein implicated in regulation of membrane protease activity
MYTQNKEGKSMLEPIWAWGILGLILLAIEMASGTFYILWFGIAALCMCAALWFFPGMLASLQLFVFAALSLSSLAIWKLNYKKTPADLRVGQSQGEEIGRTGTITEPVSLKHNGRICFAQGVMGSRDWTAIADEDIEVGADAVIIGIEGNALRVQRKAD